MKKNQRAAGLTISYINIVISMVVNFLLTPLMIQSLSDEGYSIYKIMRSLSGPLIVLNLGVSTVVARSIVRFSENVESSSINKENTYALGTLLSLITGCVVIAIGFLISLFIPTLYGNTFAPESIVMAKKMFLIFSATTSVHILTESFRGCVIGHEKFIFYHGSHTAQHVLRFSLIFLLLQAGRSALAVAFVDLLVSLAILLAYILFSTFSLREKMKLHHFDRTTFSQFASFSAAILLQAIVNQVNNNVDIIILGATISSAEIITMYSSALTIYSVFNSLLSAVPGLYLPQAMKLVARNASGEELTDFVIKPGRFQSMLAVGIVCGFAATGKSFIDLWIGKQYIDAYYVALFLMIPVTVPLIENVAITILDANLKRVYRSAVLCAMAVLNTLLTLLLIPVFGFWGAMIATCISLVLGHGLLMNLYYQIKLKMNVSRMFRTMLKGSLTSGLISAALVIPLSGLISNSITAFLVQGVLFILIYGLLLFFRALYPSERSFVIQKLKKVFASK